MTLTEMKIGIRPYSDGSGFEIEVRMDKDGTIFVTQGEDILSLKDRNQCSEVMDAIDRLWATRGEVGKMLG